MLNGAWPRVCPILGLLLLLSVCPLLSDNTSDNTSNNTSVKEDINNFQTIFEFFANFFGSPSAPKRDLQLNF